MRSRTLTIAACAALLVAAAGCATGGGQLQNTVYDTHRRVVSLDKNLEGSVTKLNETAAELLSRVNDGDQQMRTLQSTVEENRVKIEALQKSLDELKKALFKANNLSVGPSEVIVNDANATPAAPAPAPGAPPEASAKPPGEANPLDAAPAAGKTPAETPAKGSSAEADYDQASKSWANQKFDDSLQQFTAYLQQYGNSEQAANAQFWKAKSLQSLKRYEDAIQEFEKVRTNYPTHKKVPFALHQEAVCHAHLGQFERAKALMEEVIKTYPATPAADQARSDLKKLQKP